MQKGLQEDYKWTKKELLDGRIYDVEKRRTRRINPRFWQVLQALAPGALRSEYLRTDNQACGKNPLALTTSTASCLLPASTFRMIR
jgi:hypothetical protein